MALTNEVSFQPAVQIMLARLGDRQFTPGDPAGGSREPGRAWGGRQDPRPSEDDQGLRHFAKKGMREKSRGIWRQQDNIPFMDPGTTEGALGTSRAQDSHTKQTLSSPGGQ